MGPCHVMSRARFKDGGIFHFILLSRMEREICLYDDEPGRISLDFVKYLESWNFDQ